MLLAIIHGAIQLAKCAFDPNRPNAPCNDTAQSFPWIVPLIAIMTIAGVVLLGFVFGRRPESGPRTGHWPK
jgi:hypothetical protein